MCVFSFSVKRSLVKERSVIISDAQYLLFFTDMRYPDIVHLLFLIPISTDTDICGRGINTSHSPCLYCLYCDFKNKYRQHKQTT